MSLSSLVLKTSKLVLPIESVYKLTKASSRMHFLMTISFSFSSFLRSSTTVKSSMLAKVSEGEPVMGLMRATFSMSMPTLGKLLNKVRSALPSSISQVMNCGAYFFTILVSRPDEVSMPTAMPTTMSTTPTREARTMPVIFSAFFILFNL